MIVGIVILALAPGLLSNDLPCGDPPCTIDLVVEEATAELYCTRLRFDVRIRNSSGCPTSSFAVGLYQNFSKPAAEVVVGPLAPSEAVEITRTVEVGAATVYPRVVVDVHEKFGICEKSHNNQVELGSFVADPAACGCDDGANERACWCGSRTIEAEYCCEGVPHPGGT